MAAFERMIDALNATAAITPEKAQELKNQARTFAEMEHSPTARSPLRDWPEPVPMGGEELADVEPLVLDDSVSFEEPTSLDPPSIPPAAVRPPATPQRAFSDVIASFLAEHNIRWGELIAGLLIVVCSIGLVISLWNTLTSTHRIVPALIFMSGDAAIFAAGLYTMRRWKLRHTSRAVLIIATLLVPLCVLAGLAAAGASVDSVSLLSPSTMAAIVIGTFGCGWLLWQASLALVGRGSAASLTASVIAPTLCLPLLPTAARLLGANSGSFLLVPAVASAIALLIPARQYCQIRSGSTAAAMNVGRRFWKNHWLHLGIAVAAFASVVVYAAFLYQADGRTAWIQIAIATIPVWIAITAIHANYLKRIWEQPKWAMPRFLSTVLVVLAIGCVLAISPASIERVRWLWAHAAAVSISLVLTAWLLQGKLGLLAASVPFGIAAMLSSPAWLAGLNWSDVPVWRTLLGGEPLMVAIGLAILSGVVWAIRSAKADDSSRAVDKREIQPASFVLAFWAAIAGGQAIALSVAPTSWLGMVPIAGVAGILAIATIVAAVIAMRFSQLVWLSCLTAVSFWITSLGLVRWTDEGMSVAYHCVAPAMLGLSVSMLVLAMVFQLIWSRRRPDSWISARETLSRLTKISASSACAVVGIIAALAVVGSRTQWITSPTWGASTWLIAAASISLTVVAIVANNRRYLQLGMLVSVMAVFCGVTNYVGSELWQQPSWQNADALWSLAYVLVVTAAGWFVVREAVRVWQPTLSEIITTRPRMPDGWLVLGAVGLLSVAVVWQYLAVLCGPLAAPLPTGFGLGLGSPRNFAFHFVLLAGAAGCIWLWQVREPNPWLRRVLSVLGAIGGLLLAIVISAGFTQSSSMRLVGTTTLASAGILVAWLTTGWIGRVRKNSLDRLQLDRSVGFFAIALLVTLGSAVLLWVNWWLPIHDGLTPDRWSTLAVATWWMVASIGMLFGRVADPVHEQIDGAAERPRTRVDGAGQGSFLTRVGSEKASSVWRFGEDSASRLSAMLLPMAIGISIPVIFSKPAVVWWQSSVLGSAAWLILAWMQQRWRAATASESDQGAALSRVWIAGVGLTSAAVALWFVIQLHQSPWTVAWSLPLGALMSLLALVICCSDHVTAANLFDVRGSKVLRNLPFLPVVMSGHVAAMAETMGWVVTPHTHLIVMGCALVGCIGSAIVVWQKAIPLHAWHVSAQTLVLTGFTFFDWRGSSYFTSQLGGWPAWIALAGLATGAVGLMRFTPPRELDAIPTRFQLTDVLPRLLGWFIVIAGGWILLVHPDISRSSELISTTYWMGWMGACVLLWRSDRLTVSGHRRAPRADIGVSWLLLPMLALSLLDLMNWGGVPRGHSVTEIAMRLAQFMIAVAVAISAWLRPTIVPARPVSMWTISMALISSGAAVAAAGLSRLFGHSSELPVVVAILTAAVSTSLIVGTLPWSERLRVRLARRVQSSSDASSSVDRLSVATERVIVGLAWIGSFVSIRLFVGGADANLVRTSVLAIGVLAWSLFQLSEQTTPIGSETAERRRWRCVVMGLWSVAMIAVLGGPRVDAWLLTATMRLVIAGVLTIGVLVLAVPRLLRGPFLERWQIALRRGGRLSAWVTAAALLSMLGLEMVFRESGVGIPGIGKPLVVVVACLLGGLALMSGVIAILSGPGFTNTLSNQGERANWLRMDDSRRRRLLYGAQAIAGLAWLHVFLCRTGMAFLGLRQVWPYVVMVLAFASVGLTQWAIRRGDQVLSDAMRKNAMFLPLIPVIGFWLSGSYAILFDSQSWSWTFYRGTTSYQGLLIVGAIYYGVLSVMWKRGLPRIATVVLANGALWVMLTQTPGWDFLTHPQAWLIPPAVCVLAVAYWQRDQLDSTIGSAIRYGATLVIYISSTADMLMSEIGSSLWGPVILILLSLAGMLVGVAFRIKPFLYLGTIFVFLGVTSMVWHAGQTLDAVWPWWAFGITTGLILLSVLAGIEKHRDKLQSWSDELAKWEN